MMKENDCGKDILEGLHKIAPRAKLPTGINFSYKGKDTSKVIITMSKVAVGLAEEKSKNMQDDAAAFEAWAVIIHVLCKKEKVILVSPDAADGDKESGHYRRFLYRSMKFSEQYPWFSLSETLLSRVEKFQHEIQSGVYINNSPDKEADTGNSLENKVESLFAASRSNLLAEIAQEKELFIDETRIHRQLPVGVFLEKVKGKAEKENSLFTGGKSAIDLWTTSGDSIVIFELKSRNKMAGIITELMFYANYMYDMYIANNNFNPTKPKKEKCFRGYSELFSPSGFSNIKAVMLTDELHPLITNAVLDEMNRADTCIQYSTLQYSVDAVSKK